MPKENKAKQFISFKKLEDVIDSCVQPEQFDVAANMVKAFSIRFKLHSSDSSIDMLHERIMFNITKHKVL